MTLFRQKFSRWLTPAALLAISAAAFGVEPAVWNHSAEADFARGQFTSSAVTSHGELTLARDVKVLMQAQDAPPVVTAIASGNGAIYAASGSKAEVFKIADGKATSFSQLPGTMVCSLMWTGKELLAGTGGQQAGLYRIDAAGKAQPVWSDTKVKYVWALASAPDGGVYAATGPTGSVFAIDAAGKATLLYQAPEKFAKNILCLAVGKDGTLYAGTDDNGLVIAIDPAGKTSRVILNADENEISSIVVDASGAVFAATSDASLASEGPAKPATEKVGKGALLAVPASMPSSTPKMPSSAGTTSSAAKSVTTDESSEADAGDIDDSGDEAPSPAVSLASRGGAGSAASPATGPGNSVYCIQKDGLVNVVFHRPLTVLSMIMHDGRLILGTGNAGTIYSVSLDGDDVTQLARTEARQITAVAASPDGNIIFASSNKGSVGRIGQDFAREGTFTSRALDARQVARFGTIQLSAKLPEKTLAVISTRSGNVEEPDDKSWGQWSKDQPLSSDYLHIESPAGRFLQYRIRMTSPGAATPVVSRVSIVYQVGNLAPQLAAVTVQASAKDGESPAPRQPRRPGSPATPEDISPKFIRQISIRCSDPNNDQLVYAIYFRQAPGETWIKIADKLREPQYQWDTRTVADGTYELKVVASDSPSNPPQTALQAVRTAPSITVDNAPPAIKDLAAKVDGAKIAVTGLAVDASRIASIHYSLDSQEDWTSVLPDDGIADSNQEKFSFDIKQAKEGEHRIAVKVEDIYGNVGYASVSATVK